MPVPNGKLADLIAKAREEAGSAVTVPNTAGKQENSTKKIDTVKDAKAKNDANAKYTKWYPVIAIGVTYSF